MRPIKVMNTGGPSGVVVSFPASWAVVGVNSGEIQIDNNGTWRQYQDGSLEFQGTWLISGTAAEVVGFLHGTGGSATTGMLKDVDVNLNTDQSIALSTGANPKSNTSTLTIKRASDGATLDSVSISFDLDGDGGTVTMTL